MLTAGYAHVHVSSRQKLWVEPRDVQCDCSDGGKKAHQAGRTE